MITKTPESYVPRHSATTHAAASTRLQSLYVHYFFVAMASLFIAITALGFVPQLVAIHASHIQLHWFTHVHGAIMIAWLLVFLAQTLLAAKGQLKYHRQLGLFSVGLAAVPAG